MSNEQLQELAQELVDNTRKMKDLEQDIELLKLDIYDAAKGGIVCKGGRLVFIQEHTVQNLDFEKLMYALRNDIGLSEEKIAEITTKSQKVSNRYPAIAVYLDKM